MTNDTERSASESAALSADELTALKAASEGAWSKVGYSAGSRLQQKHLIEFGSDFDWKITPLGERVLAQATASAPEAEAAAPVETISDPVEMENKLPTEMTLKELIMLPNTKGIVAAYQGKEILLISDNYEDMTWIIYYANGSSESVMYNTRVQIRNSGYLNITAMSTAVHHAISIIAALRAQNVDKQTELVTLRTELAAARAQVASLREANRNLLEVAKTFVYGYWTTVHIGEKLNQLRIHISDEQLNQFRTIITAALAAVVSAPTTGQPAAGEGE